MGEQGLDVIPTARGHSAGRLYGAHLPLQHDLPSTANTSKQLIREGLEGEPGLAAGLAPVTARSHLHTARCTRLARVPGSKFLLETSSAGAHPPCPPPARRSCLEDGVEEVAQIEGLGQHSILWSPGPIAVWLVLR